MKTLVSKHCGALVCLVTLVLALSITETSAQTVTAINFSRQTMFQSPTVVCGDGVSDCRFSEWAGTWIMPDGSLMASFIIATGPASPAQGRTFMPESLLHTFGFTENGTPGYTPWKKGYDFYGLNGGCPPSPTLPTATQPCMEIVYRKSIDGGVSWTTWRTDPFQALHPAGYAPQPTIALPNGTLIRRVNGDDLQNLSVPHTAMLQALKTTDTNWPALGGSGQVVSTAADTSICKYQVSRIRALNDGRYIALGQEWKYASGSSGPCASAPDSMLLLVSASYTDVENGNWSIGMPYVSAAVLKGNEWDAAQIADGTGDLLALFRTQVGSSQVRRQARLRAKSGANCPAPTNGTIGCWVLDQTTLIDPGFGHSGHPDLIATQEGVIIEFATTGVHYTTDGSTWTTLSGFTDNVTNYYPRAIQDPSSGDIYVFSHVGCDDPYAGLEVGWGGRSYTGTPSGQGCWSSSGVNQSMIRQKFRLSVSGAPAVTTNAATSITTTTATLNGTVNPNNQSTTYSFQYGPTTSYGSTTSSQSAGSGSSPVAVSANISGLSSSTTYHFRLVATNASGTTNGTDQSFTTSASGGGGTTYFQTVLNSNPVSYWRLGESSGTTAVDQMGLNPGTYTGGVTLGVTGAVPSNTAASFDGSNDYVLAADSTSLDTGDVFTAEAWIKPSVLGVSKTIVNKFGAYFVNLDAANKIMLYKPNAGQIAISTSSISDTTNFHHVAVTKNGATIKIYLDGADVTGTVTNQTVANSTGGLYIGYLSGTPFHGVIDEVAIYNTALSAGTVSAHFAARNNTGAQPPTVTTTAATAVTSSTATLNGTVNPNGQATTYSFQYGLTTSYGSTTSSQNAGSGSSAVAVNANVSGLSPSTSYHFRLVATNSGGTTNGSDQSFTTSAAGLSYSQTVLNSNPVSYWRLGESSGTTAADQKGVNPGTYTGGVTLGVTGAVPGNTAGSFDGSNDYVLAADSASLDTGDVFTVEAWIKPSQLNVANTIVNKFGAYFINLDAANKVLLYKPNSGQIAISTSSISDTTNFHHIAVTKNGSTVKIYIDGVDVTGTVTNLTVANSTGGFYIGYLGGSPFHGVLDEVAVYNTALTGSTIAAHFAARNN